MSTPTPGAPREGTPFSLGIGLSPVGSSKALASRSNSRMSTNGIAPGSSTPGTQARMLSRDGPGWTSMGQLPVVAPTAAPAATSTKGHHGKKLGVLKGVLVPTCENMWGVLIFLRFYTIVAYAGLGLSIIIVTISFGVALFTTNALSAIATCGTSHNLAGVYPMLARALGKEIATATGLVYFLGIISLAVLECLGACEELFALDTTLELTDFRFDHYNVRACLGPLGHPPERPLTPSSHPNPGADVGFDLHAESRALHRPRHPVRLQARPRLLRRRPPHAPLDVHLASRSTQPHRTRRAQLAARVPVCATERVRFELGLGRPQLYLALRPVRGELCQQLGRGL